MAVQQLCKVLLGFENSLGEHVVDALFTQLLRHKLANLAQRKPRVLEAEHAVEPIEVFRSIETLVVRPLRTRREDALLVVILHAAHRDTGTLRYLSHRHIARRGRSRLSHSLSFSHGSFSMT